MFDNYFEIEDGKIIERMICIDCVDTLNLCESHYICQRLLFGASWDICAICGSGEFDYSQNTEYLNPWLDRLLTFEKLAEFIKAVSN